MTGEPAIPGKHIPLEVVNKMVSEIMKVDGLSRVFYDITTKPPGIVLRVLLQNIIFFFHQILRLPCKNSSIHQKK